MESVPFGLFIYTTLGIAKVTFYLTFYNDFCSMFISSAKRLRVLKEISSSYLKK